MAHNSNQIYIQEILIRKCNQKYLFKKKYNGEAKNRSLKKTKKMKINKISSIFVIIIISVYGQEMTSKGNRKNYLYKEILGVSDN